MKLYKSKKKKKKMAEQKSNGERQSAYVEKP